VRILHVVHQFFPQCHSGTEQYCLAVAQASRRAGHEVRILSLGPIDDQRHRPFHAWNEPYDGFDVLRIQPWRELTPNDDLRDWSNPLVAARVALTLDEFRPDAVHVFHLRRLGVEVLRTIEARRRAGVVGRLVVHLMDFWFLCPRFTLLRSDGSVCEGPPDGGLGCIRCHAPELLAFVDDPDARAATRAFVDGLATVPAVDRPEARVAAIVRRKDEVLGLLERTADAVLAPSTHLRDLFVANGFPRDRIEVVPYGLEPGRVERRDVARPRSPLRIGFAGVFSPWKGAHVLVDAVRARPGLAVSVTLHGRLEEPMFAEYIDDLRSRAADDPRFAFPGPFGRAELSDVLADLDVLVVPSTWHENTPFVILEAFAAGVPVIASRLGGMAEIVEHERNGLLFAAGDSDDLGRCLERVVDELDLLASLRPAAPGTVDDDAARFAALYRGAAVAP
jgi:glycosyltransferase involved in cell wall biosynthesis